MFDEAFFVILGLGILLIPIVSIIVAIIAINKAGRLNRQLIEFRQQVVEKFQELEKSGLQPPPAAVKAEERPQDVVSEPAPEPDEAQQAAPPTDVPEEEDEQPSPEEAEIPAAASQQAGETKATRPKENLESRIGGRWTVLLGGLALALGIVFLARYTIEAGLLGPGARLLLGAALSILFLLAGEWLRRSDRSFNLPVYEKADVPGILTAAGVSGLFAVLYAAHALYGFAGPGITFVGLTVIGIAAVLLSSVHGPKLAALGALGAYATPVLISTDSPNPIALALHILAVTAVVMSVARIRAWQWLAAASAVAAAAWTGLAAATFSTSTGIAGAMLLVGLAAIFAVAFGYVRREEMILRDEKTHSLVILVFGLFTLGFLVQLAINNDLPAIVTGLAVAAILMAAAALRPPLGPISAAGAVVVLLTIAAIDVELEIVDGLLQTEALLQDLVPRDTSSFVRNAFLVSVPPVAIAIWGAWRSVLPAPVVSGWLAGSTTAIGFLSLVVSYLRIAPFETRPLFGAIGLAVAAAFVFGTEAFTRRKPEDMTAPAPAALAVGAVCSVSFAIGVSLDLGWMPLAFCLSALGIAAVYIKRPIRLLPWLSVASGGLGAIALWFKMPLAMPEISTTVVLNELLTLLALPAAALIAGGEILRRHNSPTPSALVTSLGLAIAGLFVALELVHLINGGDLASARQSLAETAAHAIAALAFAIGLQQVARITGAEVYDKASMAAGAVSVAFIGLGLLFVFNPAFDDEPVGSGLVFNLLLPGYLLTGVVAAAVALLSRDTRPRWYTLTYAALSGLLLFSYFSLMLRKGFQGEELALWRTTSDLEFWLYSVLWLIMGGILLAIGLRLKSFPVRAASGVLIGLTVLKVFLLDMGELTGVLRAFSFIGLGLCLIVIGRFYQRLLTREAFMKMNESDGDG